MDADDSHVTRLTDDPAGDYRPTWSPDGTRLTHDPAIEGWPAWSP